MLKQPNYQKELENILKQIKMQISGGEKAPTLFLHSCCAPCSSYVLKYLREYFRIMVYYYNPNISEQEEYKKRVEEQKRLIALYNGELLCKKAGESAAGYPIEVMEGSYEPEAFFAFAREYKDCPEGGERCFLCYEQRLRRTAMEARKRGSAYFATTLTISPLKNAVKLNEIGFALQEATGVKWLPSDFKKKEGYKQSIELSAQYELYRQDYCGCVYSKAERERQKEKKS